MPRIKQSAAEFVAKQHRKYWEQAIARLTDRIEELQRQLSRARAELDKLQSQ